MAGTLFKCFMDIHTPTLAIVDQNHYHHYQQYRQQLDVNVTTGYIYCMWLMCGVIISLIIGLIMRGLYGGIKGLSGEEYTLFSKYIRPAPVTLGLCP